MEKLLNIGLIGFGAMGKAHLYSIDSLKFFSDGQRLGAGARVVALCTAHPDRASQLAEEYSIGRAVDSEDAIFEDDSIDIVDVCTPNQLHISSIRKALEYNKHLLCEKPVTASIEEAREAAELAREAERRGLVWGTVFNNRHLSPVMRAKQLIDEGRLGDILSFDFKYYHDSCIDRERRVGWKQTAEAGGGTLADLGPHAIDLCHLLVGRLKNVSARSQIAFSTHTSPDGSVWRTNADEAFYLTCEAECGAIGSISVSKIVLGSADGLSFEIYGSRGAVKFDLTQPNWLYFYDGEQPVSPLGGCRGYTRIECIGRYTQLAAPFPSAKATVGWLRGHVMSMANYIFCVAHEQAVSPSLVDGIDVMSVMDAARRSDESLSRVTDVEYILSREVRHE